ncbi:MazG nucleotide pyrophosphohydrolase domain-containing protein [Arthrobacter sp. H14-L1]|uniref:MazG nucleotide pyrophosphohydrolase domain-containing protein n=1 Tax=Arthrobacter sp. H14-L1 TaxID=2996697 RepID=UPI003B641753
MREPAGPDPAVELRRLIEVIAQLRQHCPWMAELTHESLVQYLIEESYELVEAIETGSRDEIRGELGDILLQVVLHARLAQETGAFDIADVAQALTAKMIRRSPHVFDPNGSLLDGFPTGPGNSAGPDYSAGPDNSAGPGDLAEIEATWRSVKNVERALAGAGSVFHGIPAALPALALAQKSLDRALPTTAALPGPEPLHGGPESAPPQSEEELGELLFAVVRTAHSNGWDAERALRTAVRRFQNGADSENETPAAK